MQSPLQRTEMPPAAPLAPSVPATLTEMDVRRKELVPAAAESMMPMGLTPLAAPLPVVLPAEALEASQPEVLPALKAPLAELEPTIAGELEIASPAAFTSQVGSDAAPAESQTPAEIEPCLPESALQVEQPSPEMPAEAAEPTNVVRIRVLRDDDLVAPVSEPVEETISLPELASEQTPAVEPEPEPVVEPEPDVETVSAMELEPEIEFLAEIAPPRPKVVEMRAQAPSAALAELEVPGGFHEPEVLARLLTEEAPFNGLAIAISPADYVRLLADLGKQAMEQLMGTISRMVVSMTREHDFACRIAEDEFILLFVGETGGAAKRRTQLVSERLWDFQLRSLGSTSVIFSWGAMESTNQTLAQAIEGARERMLETRRSRRVSGVGGNRFRNRLAI
jgi:chemotaxis protein histidine kinase CheA